MSPLQFQEEVEIRLEQMDDSQSVDSRFPGIFLDKNVVCVAPSGYQDYAPDCDVKKL